MTEKSTELARQAETLGLTRALTIAPEAVAAARERAVSIKRTMQAWASRQSESGEQAQSHDDN